MKDKLQKRASRLVANEVYCHVGGLIEKMQEYANESSFFEAITYEFLENVEPTDEQVAEYIKDNTTENYTPDRDEAYNELQLNACDILEYWAVSDWLADKLRDNGEPVATFGLTNVWGRGTSGQAIAIDYVIEKITEDSEYAKFGGDNE